MWAKLSHLILRNRVTILVVMSLVTAFMVWQASQKLELSYKYARVLPVDDPMYINYEKFKARYGEDGSVMVIGFQDSTMFRLDKFQGWYDLTDSIRKISGVQDVMSTARLYNLRPNDSLQKFDVYQVVSRRPQTQEEADSLKKAILRLPFYEGLIMNRKDWVSVMAITFTQRDLNSKNRLSIVAKIHELSEAFAQKYNIEKSGVDADHNGKVDSYEMSSVHHSGMPWIRSEYMRKIAGESTEFLILSVLITALILFIFFRYFNAVFFSLIVVIVGLAWSLGTIALLGYKITILTGLIPSLIVIIGIPNCIFLINKYQEELLRHGHKTKALARMVQKVGLSNFLANITTSIGFGVFYFTNSSLLVEFGVVAAINVMTTYFIALILTPIIFSYLPAPKPKQMKHLSGKRINKVMDMVDSLVHKRRKLIYAGVAIVTIVAALGFYKIRVNGYVVDDLPQGDPILNDLKFFEKHFGGVLPFEVALEVKQPLTAAKKAELAKKGIKYDPKDFAADTLGPKNIFDQEGAVLDSINVFQERLMARPEFSKPVSVVEAVKFSYQALKHGNPKAYRLPGNLGDLSQIGNYYKQKTDTPEGDTVAAAAPVVPPNAWMDTAYKFAVHEGKIGYQLRPAYDFARLKNLQQQKLSAFLDTTYRYTRISFQMADVGSDSSQRIVSKIRPVVDSLFPSKYFKVDLTGNSLMFLQSFHYMLHHLFVSLLIAILLILLLGMALFRSVWIIVLSKLPCLIPLVITAGIMGYLGIPFKSSTILIFSIAFGIASDGTIYILTEYRHQLRKLSPSKYSTAVSNAIHETGLSMVYTNIILFFGFAIFVLSSFGGTVALGILLSITLVVSLATNLILLPCILLSLEKRAATKALLKEPLIEIYDEEEDIDSNKLFIQGDVPKE